MAVIEAGKHAPGRRPVPPVKTGLAHRLRKRFYPNGMWDRYVDRISEQDRAHQAQQDERQKIRKGPPPPPSSSQPSRRFTGSSGPKFTSYPYTAAYCLVAGACASVVGIASGQPSALVLGAGLVGVPIVLQTSDNVERRGGTEDSGPR